MLFQKKYKAISILMSLVLITLMVLSSCKKFVEEKAPITQVVSENVFNSDDAANAAIIGIYSKLSASGFASGTNQSVTFFSTFLGDEMEDWAGNYSSFATNSLTSSNILSAGLWLDAYQIIYYCNSAIRGMENSTKLSTGLKNRLLGEAKFIRAFCYFYLTGYYGNVPLVLSPDFNDTKLLSRSPVSIIVEQMKTDLIEAVSLLPEGYGVYQDERIRVNRAAASALLSRIYLYNREWSNAETTANDVLSLQDYSVVMNLDETFLANSGEAIWQLQPVSNNNTNEATWAIIPPGTPAASYSLRQEFINSFAANDQRLAHWVGNIDIDGIVYYYPYKYKVYVYGEPVTEYSMVLRLAEVYLIRAEARVMQNNIAGAQDDLNVIRSRAELDNTTADTQDELLAAIQDERKWELFSEWGHRWLDLIRWDKANTVLEPLKSPNWQLTDTLLPIPQTELAKGPNLTQNDGY